MGRRWLLVPLYVVLVLLLIVFAHHAITELLHLFQHISEITEVELVLAALGSDGGEYLQRLQDAGLVTQEPYRSIFLTGEAASPNLTERGFKWFFRTTPHDDLFVQAPLGEGRVHPGEAELERERDRVGEDQRRRSRFLRWAGSLV